MSDSNDFENQIKILPEDVYTAALSSALRRLYDSGLSKEDIQLIINMNCLD